MYWYAIYGCQSHNKLVSRIVRRKVEQ